MKKNKRGCTGKARHSNPEHAQRQIDKTRSKGYDQAHLLTIYRCNNCRSYHVGHRNPDFGPPSGSVLKFLISQALVEDKRRMETNFPDI